MKKSFLRGASTVAILAVSAIGFASYAAAQDQTPLFPPNAEPGHCYARLFVPATYSTKTEQVVKQEAAEKIEVIPARYEWIEEKVLVKEAAEKIEIVPATFKTVEEKVMVEPESQELVDVEAQYETVEENVLVKAAYTTWKKGTGPISRLDESTGEIMCLITVPAEYKTVKKRVLKAPAATKVVTKPAVYKMVKKQVVDVPATTKNVTIPAKYETVKVKKLIEPAKEKRTAIPAEYQTVTKTEKVSDGHMEWREILCQTNVTTDVIKSMQAALKDKGHYGGPVDGQIGSGTRRAVASYQQARGLASGELTIETLKSLGVSL
jgi:Putative peptidoglycan binding domain